MTDRTNESTADADRTESAAESDWTERPAESDRISTSDALALLADDRRRRLLLDLLECDPDDRIRVGHGIVETGAAVELYHNHLPRLAEADVITWETGGGAAWNGEDDRARGGEDDLTWDDEEDAAGNDEGDAVGRGDAFDDLRPFVERLDQHRDELPDDWRGKSVHGW